MGLDMYLSKKTYVKRWEHKTPEEQYEVSVKKGGVTYPNVNPERISYVTEEITYWRKANQIHGWFVENTEEIVDNVKYYVTRENLEELLSTCKQVLDLLNKSKKTTTQVVAGWRNGEEYKEDVEVYEDVDDIMDLLPPTQGFFFGSYEVDDWYKEQIVDTITALENELSIESDDYGAEYEYYASW